MVHYTCDLCSRKLGAASSSRYIVKVTAHAAHDPARVTEDDLDADSLEAVAAALQADAAAEQEPAPDFVELRFDLCDECHARYVRDPLNRDPVRAPRFSKN